MLEARGLIDLGESYLVFDCVADFFRALNLAGLMGESGCARTV
jgi:hypothetical protein